MTQQVEQAIPAGILLRYNQKYKKGVMLSSSGSRVLIFQCSGVEDKQAKLSIFAIFLHFQGLAGVFSQQEKDSQYCMDISGRFPS